MRALLLLSLALLGAFDAPGIERTRHTRHLAMAGSTCNVCRKHEENHAVRREAIKEQILNKLGLKQVPDMTGGTLSKIPPIFKLTDMYGMQADQPQPFDEPIQITHDEEIVVHEETDEDAAQTKNLCLSDIIGVSKEE